MKELYRLGMSDLHVSPIGLGTWQFSGGRGLVGKFWQALTQEEANKIVSTSLTHGVTWFDTAEVYGNGVSEHTLAQALRDVGSAGDDVVIATKWFPAFRFASSLGKTFPARVDALGGRPIDLHQIHQPFSFSSVEAQSQELVKLLDAGHIRAAGVSNFNEDFMRRAHKVLSEAGFGVATNQMRYSLIDREIERNGVLDAAKELGISIIAYSPLSQGILTGRFHGAAGEDIRNRPGPRKWMGRFKAAGLEATAGLVSELRSIGEKHGATAAQVALAWTVQRHGTTIVAIPGASSERQAQSNGESMNITLTAEEIETLDQLGLAAEKQLKKS